MGRVTPDGQITEIAVPTAGAVTDSITMGLDGNLWFTESSPDKIGRVTPSGIVTEFPLPSPGMRPFSIIAGPDGALWFLEKNDSSSCETYLLVRMTVDGSMTEFSIPPAPYEECIYQIAVGPDGNLWFGRTATFSPCKVFRFVL